MEAFLFPRFNRILISFLTLVILGSPGLAQNLSLESAGAACPLPVCFKWFHEYGKESGVRIHALSLGLENQAQHLMKHTVDFVALDSFRDLDRIAKGPEALLAIPAAVQAVAVVYNLPGIKKLKLDGEVLARIYLGEIGRWNDPALQKLNEGIQLPDTVITVAFRMNENAATSLFIRYLGQANAIWVSRVGPGDLVQWPTGVGVKGSGDMAELVKHTPGCMGYLDLAEALQNRLTCALMRNKAGKFVEASIKSTAAAIAGVNTRRLRTMMTNAPGLEAYPLCGFIWLVACQNQPDAEKGKELADFLNWCLGQGQEMAPTLDCAPLTDSLIEAGKAQVALMKY